MISWRKCVLGVCKIATEKQGLIMTYLQTVTPMFVTPAQLENFFGKMKHSERCCSSRKNLTRDLNHTDYVSIVCELLEELLTGLTFFFYSI